MNWQPTPVVKPEPDIILAWRELRDRAVKARENALKLIEAQAKPAASR